MLLITPGQRIRHRRIELGWTQDQLAAKAGISGGFLSDVENDKRNVSAENLLSIAEALGVSLDYLMRGMHRDAPEKEVIIPGALAQLAREEGLTFRQTMALLQMQGPVLMHWRYMREGGGDRAFDWRKFYESVKDYLGS